MSGQRPSPQMPPPKPGESQSPVVKALKNFVWNIRPDVYNLRKLMMHALERSVDSASRHEEDEHDALGAKSWLVELFDEETYEKLFASEHWGNFVIVRSTGKRDWEEMPIYARVGMHLLFHGPAQIRLLHWSVIRKLLKEQSIRQGRIYDEEGPAVVHRINSFAKTYDIDLKVLLIQDPSGYKTFNEFFYRKLKPNARPPASPTDPSIICSAADCRLVVFQDVEVARTFWIKGKSFTIPSLLGSPTLALRFAPLPSVAVFRLAPQDYHRFHSPVDGTVESVTTLPGDYFTVNPQAVNETLDIFTANRRDVLIINANLFPTKTGETPKTVPVAFVAVGALLVGSVNWSKKPGETLRKGDDLGWFAYGGSTVVCVFPQGAGIQWDQDLHNASSGEWVGEEDAVVTANLPSGVDFEGRHAPGKKFGMEVLVKVGERIGAATGPLPTS